MFCKCGSILQIPDTEFCVCKNCSRKVKADFPEVVFEKVYLSKEVESHNEVAAPKIEQNCPKCNSKEMHYNTIQTRSADEGQTVFYSCTCGYKMKVDS